MFLWGFYVFHTEERVQNVVQELRSQFGEQRAWVGLFPLLHVFCGFEVLDTHDANDLSDLQGKECDVRDAKSIQALADYVKTNLGYVDIWVRACFNI